MQTKKQEKGQKGEQMAADYLRSKGYQILETNWRVGHLEVDIIAIDGDMLVFAEVKTRSSSAFGSPEVFVDIAKQRHLIRAANVFIGKSGIGKEVRFDIISIVLGEGAKSIKHIEDAFKPRW